jgi:hypothetical protein
LSRELGELGLFLVFWSWVFEHGVSEFAGFWSDFLLGLILVGLEWDGLEDWIGLED